MSDSTNPLDQVSQTAIQREVTTNSLFDAASPATVFGRRASTCAALAFGYYGGRFNGTSVANGTVSATDSTTNYVVAHRSTLAVTISTATTNWNDAGTYMRLYKLVASGGAITSYEDHRAGLLGLLPTVSNKIILTPAYAASLTVDLAAYTSYDIVVVRVGTLTGNITFNLTNGTEAQIIRARFTQDGSGNRTFTPGGSLRFGTDITAITLSTAANKVDKVAFEWDGAASKADVLAITKGF